MTDPSLLLFCTAVFCMLVAIWFIMVGIGIFVESEDKDGNFLLTLFLTAVGAFLLCVSLVMLMVQALRIVGVNL